jgi:hypothetical protein
MRGAIEERHIRLLPWRDHVGGLLASGLVVPRIKAFLAALG